MTAAPRQPATPRSSLLHRSLPARLSTAVLALGVSTVVIVTFVSYRFAETSLRERLLERLNARIDGDRASIEEWVERQRSAVEFAARMPAIRESSLLGDRAPDAPAARAAALTALREVIDDLQRHVIAATEVRVLSVPGAEVIASTVRMNEGGFAVDEEHYRRGRDSTFTQNIYPSTETGRPTLTIASPVTRRGEVRAVLAAHLDLSAMELAIAGVSGSVPIDGYVVSSSHEFVSAERFGRPEFRRGAHSLGIDRAIAGENGAALYDNYEGRPVLGVWRWMPSLDLALLLEAPQQAAFAPARRLLLVSLLVGLVATGLLTIGVVAITRRATQPLLAAADAAERVARGDFSAEAPVQSEDEVGQLSRAFNAMTARLRTLYGELNDQVETTRSALRDAQASRSLLQDVVDNTTALVCVVGLDRMIRLANTRFASLLVDPTTAPIGQSLADVVPASVATPFNLAIDAAQRGDTVVERELELATGTESHTWLAVCFPLRDPQRRTYAIGVIATDLTERARAEEERRQRDATVQQAQKLESLGIMAGGIAHDFNNILGAVLGNAEVGLSRLDDRAAVRESLEQVASAARRAADLTRQMLAYAGKASLRSEVTDLRTVLLEMVAFVRAAQPKKVDFIVDPMPDPLWVEVDAAQLSQVALNLLTNAAEAIGDAVGSVTLSASRDRGRVRFSITDTGSGMSAEVQRRMFEPFFTTKGSGRGLGLSAVQGIIRSCGGDLRLSSREGAGTRINVDLPEASAPTDLGRPPVAPAAKPRRGTALVVDDEIALRRVMRRVLEPMGLAVVEAADGLAAVETFRAHREELAVVVLDLTMPGMDGAEVLSVIRARSPELPVIIASGYDASERGSAIPKDPYTHFLQKPFGIDVLTRLVADLLG